MSMIPIFQEGMEPLLFNPADFTGFSFTIKIEDMDFNAVLNTPPKKMEHSMVAIPVTSR
ncbi:MAG: hypothetical protein QMD94_00205 [Candidatus Omnitrophota bacterium]|nr:hypothetical protein [Candidatus Omnitrophota bacterium]